MNIRELIQVIDYTGLSEAKPKVKQDAQGNWVDAATGQPAQAPAADNTVPFPNQQQAPAAQAPAQAAGPTGDPVLDQPIDQAAPKPKKTMAQRIGGVAKAVGAIPGAWQGAKAAYQKGKADMATRVGGPVNQPQAAGGTQQASGQQAAGGGAAGGGNMDKELDDLRQMINRIDAKLVKAGIKEKKN